MKRNRLFQIFISDHDTQEYAISRPIPLHSITTWIYAIIEQQRAGRDIRYEEFAAGDGGRLLRNAEQQGFVVTDMEVIIPDTDDRSADYTGKLPQYAASADRSKLVKFLCKGKCGCERFAELNREFPGIEQLRSADMFQFTATCLMCGYEANDNHNWGR